MKTYLFNPFVKIAGLQALIFGLVFLILSSVLSFCFKGIFDGALDFHIVEKITLSDSIKCVLIDILSLVIIFYPLGLILNKGKVRFIDIIGTFSYARLPMLLLPLTNIGNLQSGITKIIMDSLANKTELNISAPQIVFLVCFIVILLAVLVWYVALLYKAFTVSANLKGTKAIISFIAGLLLAEILSKILIFTL